MNEETPEAADTEIANSEVSPQDDSSSEISLKSLRIWPVAVLLVVLISLRSILFLSSTESMAILMMGVFGPVLCSLMILIWWFAGSRASGKEKILGGLFTIIAAAIVLATLDKTMYGPGVMLFMLPIGFGLFALTSIILSKWKSARRTIFIVSAAVVGFLFVSLFRNEGMWGNNQLGLQWRWVESVEDKLAAIEDTRAKTELTEIENPELEEELMNPQWASFRGNNREGVLTDIELQTDWKEDVSEPLWKIPIGPGWGSFVVAGDLLFAQEQRGEMEAIVCYHALDGSEVWKQEIKSRFEDPLGGPGPRATPTLANGSLFAMGANGNLLRLDPKTGEIVWQKDLQEIANRKPPMWGFSSSPLIVNSLVVVHAGGEDDKGTFAFDVETGDIKWSVAAGDHTYSSPHLLEIAGQPVIAMMTNKELKLLNPEDGKVLLNYECPLEGYRALQPHLLDDDSILVSNNMGKGIERIKISVEDDQWTAETVWETIAIKPDFNDFVVYQNHAYGFDGRIFACLDLKDGKRKWKGGRYGKGQVLLLDKAGQLLVISEKGEVILVDATPTGLKEIAKFQGLEGKTWNHPVLIYDRLYIRNSQEAALYRLPLQYSLAK